MKYYKKNGTLFETISGTIVPCSSSDLKHRMLADQPQYMLSDHHVPKFKSKY